MEKFIYKGKIDIDSYGCLTCDGEYLIDKISEKIKSGDKIFISYYISNKEITEEEAKEIFLISTFGGEVESINFILEAYSEWTIMDYVEEFKIGGHDLYKELSNYDGSYLLLIIEKI